MPGQAIEREVQGESSGSRWPPRRPFRERRRRDEGAARVTTRTTPCASPASPTISASTPSCRRPTAAPRSARCSARTVRRRGRRVIGYDRLVKSMRRSRAGSAAVTCPLHLAGVVNRQHNGSGPVIGGSSPPPSHARHRGGGHRVGELLLRTSLFERWDGVVSMSRRAVRAGAAALVGRDRDGDRGSRGSSVAAPSCRLLGASPKRQRVPCRRNALSGRRQRPLGRLGVGYVAVRPLAGADSEFLIEHWNGREWQRTAAPTSPAVRSELLRRRLRVTTESGRWGTPPRQPGACEPRRGALRRTAWREVDGGTAGIRVAVDESPSNELGASARSRRRTADRRRCQRGGTCRGVGRVDAPAGADLHDVAVVSSTERVGSRLPPTRAAGAAVS